ncbi:hypothetical protein B0T20DRAFT_388144 [Sordaria brevicollis]|uniref:Uncharacterized protein n=1 Tax=Sordaria brevicollis TaxID=83679 RepID=A0AAE0UFN7_SORBR|nr:hypothetical protein B0T20DRAFT_388144 [Sordaria brevicollis]
MVRKRYRISRSFGAEFEGKYRNLLSDYEVYRNLKRYIYVNWGIKGGNYNYKEKKKRKLKKKVRWNVKVVREFKKYVIYTGVIRSSIIGIIIRLYIRLIYIRLGKYIIYIINRYIIYIKVGALYMRLVHILYIR